jgi:ubiquinone/menaquinone biosynthesis C-methylase UbiE
MSTANPFLDSVPRLYATPDRLASRTDALHRAKISGRHVAKVIAELAPLTASVVADIGCGRGTTTAVLASRLSPSALIAVDASAALLAAARQRVPGARFVCADFHSMPLANASCELVVAAFCLYHSREPRVVLAEIARCLVPGGTAILVTKSADSYRELDALVAATGLDPAATERPSLYETANSTNLPQLTREVLHVRGVIHERHRFRFADVDHLAEYLTTSPKYVLAGDSPHHPADIAAELGAHLPDGALTTSSTVTYVFASRP